MDLGYAFWMTAWTLGWAFALFTAPWIARARGWSTWPVLAVVLVLGPIVWHLILLVNGQSGLLALDGVLHLIYLVPLGLASVLIALAMTFAARLVLGLRSRDPAEVFATGVAAVGFLIFGVALLAAVLNGAFSFGP